MRDLVYIYDKNTFEKETLGEVQKRFNFGMTIDGSKDSCKLNILSYREKVVEPNTILFHEKTNTWWVVSHDNTERYPSENNTFVYNHSLQLVGAIELLNARDLTDSGFYQNNYTIRQFFARLLKLSTFEFKDSFELLDNGNLYLDKNIDYIKTFENYTPLSAIRELFEAYNVSVKLSFVETNNKLTKAIFTLYSKAGNVNETIDISFFNDSREKRNIDKNSYGSVVVSNAESVISTKSKIYPSVGTIKLSSNSYKITSQNALIRLPSNINKINWVRLSRPTELRILISYNGTTYTRALVCDAYDEYALANSYKQLAVKVKEAVKSLTDSDSYANSAYNIIINNKSSILAPYTKAQSITLYDGWSYDPVSHNYIAPTDNPDFYFPQINYSTRADRYEYTGPFVISEKNVRDSLYYANSSLSYTRGKNIIEGFNYLREHKEGQTSSQLFVVQSYQYTDLRDASYDNERVYWTKNVIAPIPVVLSAYLSRIDSYSIHNFTIFNTRIVVNYVPMSDIKIKTDNTGYDKDTHIYNQNGKLTDSVALSKLINSYSKEIQSDNITKYGVFYDYNLIPNVGTIVNDNGSKYVINNISYDFTENENYTYEINCEFSLSKYVATKTLMINPNSNIRDYGIPQNNNVVRKQVYRDFYELDKSFDPLQVESKYMGLEKTLNLSTNVQNLNQHIAVIRMKYESAFGTATQDKYYYQLETTTYVLKKAIYEVVNFNDNNIIGYGSQNVYSGFDITRIFTGLTDLITTPISYVDDNGKAKGIDVCFCNLDQLTYIYNSYIEHKKIEHPEYESFNSSIYNYSVFIDSEIFEGINVVESFTYVGDFQYSPFGSGYTATIDLTDKNILPSDFSGELEELSINTINLLGVVNVEFYKNNENHIILTFRFLTFPSPTDRTIQLTIDYSHFVNGANTNNDFAIREDEYYKDPLEVPFFEYGMQIDDTENVLVGENVLDNKEEDLGYIYQFLLVDKGLANDNNYLSFEQPSIIFGEETITYDNGVSMRYDSENHILISLYGNGINEQLLNRINVEDLPSDKDLVIVRNTFKGKKDLMLVISNLKDFQVVDNELVLCINHYKLN